jgi:hypothetical protein
VAAFEGGGGVSAGVSGDRSEEISDASGRGAVSLIGGTEGGAETTASGSIGVGARATNVPEGGVDRAFVVSERGPAPPVLPNGGGVESMGASSEGGVGMAACTPEGGEIEPSSEKSGATARTGPSPSPALQGDAGAVGIASAADRLTDAIASEERSKKPLAIDGGDDGASWLAMFCALASVGALAFCISRANISA